MFFMYLYNYLLIYFEKKIIQLICLIKKFFQFKIHFIGGKRDEDLILPVNDSISASLDTEHVWYFYF